MRRTRRILGMSIGLVIVLLVLTAGILFFLSERHLLRTYDIAAETPLSIPTDSASLAHGRHLVTSVATCVLCHGEDLGGAVYIDAGPLGIVTGPNLTTGRGGIGAIRTDTDLERAIRHGVRQDHTSLIVMPSEVFVHLSDSDMAAMIAYLRQLPPIDRELPTSHFGLLGRGLLAMGKLPLLVAGKTPSLAHLATAEPEATISYGRYLADIAGCHGCHGYGLSGGRVAGPSDLPPASNLTVMGSGLWREEDFKRAMREGRRLDGSTINEFMPWRLFSQMTDAELSALWLYLKSVPAKPFGNK